ncbi:post-GPI attachment to proteins factor 3-like [Prunus yedoensis var. nudiflora]|uniref:Post-GPI attachment to proteins factor 3 n=1 Tax=Prunus yedoensis var. nudiflora TaxID=2094558 RepID=A0A314YK96_PRUYE|nr:post-GPI attachment to proteins factor 3-like [Prunus yedoensis var. nudiflora]
MALLPCILFLTALCSLIPALHASAGDADPIYKSCVVQCEKSGCVGENMLYNCKFYLDGNLLMVHGTCKNRFICAGNNGTAAVTAGTTACLLGRKRERNYGDKPVKYHGKWPFQRVYGIQEPVAVALSALNLAMQFHGLEWCISQPRCGLTEKLDISSAVALLGFSLILALLRAFNVRDEAARVMVSAPLIAFVTTHILYLNFYKLDYGLNMKVCMAMGIAQLLTWALWAGVDRHPSRWKLWVVVAGGGLAMFLRYMTSHLTGVI